ncbi:MAG: hypothetical protein JWQ57_3221, partial [Mucilaginibacter sp.]|nr:hypothetical protein [Mucilaginibacter sp.]
PSGGHDKKGIDLSRYKIDVKVVSRIEEVFGLLFG